MYGTGTRSYNRSTEKRNMDRLRREATEQWKPKTESVIVGPVCNCRSFRFPHYLEAHRKLRADFDWRLPEERTYEYDEY